MLLYVHNYFFLFLQVGAMAHGKISHDYTDDFISSTFLIKGEKN